jgi:L-lactate dehydrogenase
MTNMAGVPFESFCEQCRKCDDRQALRQNILEEVRRSAYHIIGYKGATWFAVGLALTHIAAAILRNQHGVLTVSAVLEGEYGLSGVSLGVPCILSREGVTRILQVDLPAEELAALRKSAGIVHEALATLTSPVQA